ncbi:hypothetical protein NDU88_005984 [Pleurodeles waltl]|uniref:Uncharacterized protein n=1 Tax=Pleurodeles waltl TaxID=8319 RepID=A0AAV7RQL2_PLEWA|nr:hypothetical protein NDU88_005984 [Pleurodeles waltl]
MATAAWCGGGARTLKEETSQIFRCARVSRPVRSQPKELKSAWCQLHALGPSFSLAPPSEATLFSPAMFHR